jgi:ABC-type sugar transport system permease subunit
MLTRRERLLLLAPLALILLPFLIGPALFGLLASFTNYAPAELHVHAVGLANYADVLRDTSFISSWRNIIVFVLVSVLAELALGLGIAYLLREPFRGRALVRVLLLVPWLISPIANGVMWHFLLNLQWGILNFAASLLRLPTLPSPLGSTVLALPTTIVTDIWRKVPLASFLLLPGLLAIPSEQWEYATIEGASTFTRIRHIALPWLRPLLLTVGLLLVGDALGTYDSILVLTGGGPGSATYTPALYSYLQAFQYFSWSTGATSAWFIVAAVILFGLVYLRLVRPEAA